MVHWSFGRYKSLHFLLDQWCLLEMQAFHCLGKHHAVELSLVHLNCVGSLKRLRPHVVQQLEGFGYCSHRAEILLQPPPDIDCQGSLDCWLKNTTRARGNDTGNIEVFLIGKDLNMEYISMLENKIEDLIGRKVSFYLASRFLSDRENIILFNSKDK